MKIGIFDSGLGGLYILNGLLKDKRTKNYDYFYLGDTKNVPYGNKSQEQIYKLTVRAIEYLFRQNCALVIVACNTSSSEALRRIQQNWLPKSRYKDRKVLGVIRPTVESTGRVSSVPVGIIGTKRTVDSKAYIREFRNFNPKIKVHQLATPLLTPMIEAGNLDKIDEVLAHYLETFRKKKIKTLILACTHYCVLDKKVQKIMGKDVKVISQDKLIPTKLASYLKKHREIDAQLSKTGKVNLVVTQKTQYTNSKMKVVK